MVADERQLAQAGSTPTLNVRPEVTVGHVTRDVRRRAMKTSERVSLDIVRDIVAQGLRTGDRLPLEAAMAQQYGVSRASLREALRLLEVQGLIHLKPGPGGGPVVGSVEPSNLARTASLYFHLGGATYGQLMQTQVLLEPLCAQLAARHPDRREIMAPFTRRHRGRRGTAVSDEDGRLPPRRLGAGRQSRADAAHRSRHAPRHPSRRLHDGPRRAPSGHPRRTRRAGPHHRSRARRTRRAG